MADKEIKETSSDHYQSRLKTDYYRTIQGQLVEELNLKNVYQAPKLDKVIVSVGLGRFKDDKNMFQTATNTLTKITGQKPVTTIAKKSVANFKLRQGQVIGLKVTLRGERMYDFLERLINLAMPRLRDFRGGSLNAFDRSGNYSIGLKEQSVFPELTFAETHPSHGLQITCVICNNGIEESKLLLEKLGFCFRRSNKSNKQKV